ncbi:MAG: alpha/beta hydrolase domain-containing protein, partial [Alphaproteobacteria bacterium]|nr:alpha/beta hydrolase domain-containing protein [Alphaproteobacteria bacterium]
DPLSGRHEDLLARARAAGALPKLFYTQTSTDYWSRSASLLHTDVSGSRDLPLDPSARLYVFVGGQHGVWVLPRRGRFALCHNPADYRPVLRALLLRLDGWMSGRTMPPASVYPNLAGGSLGTLAEYRRRFPKLPEAAGSRLPPGQYLRPPRLDLGPRFRDAGIIDRQPPKFGPPFEARLPLPDADGIDLGGIRLPRIAVPLGSHVGWNPRRDGAADAIGRWAGGYIPFAADPVAAAAGDSRRPLSARYRDRQDYVAKVGAAADRLVQRGFLLPGDVAAIAGAAALYYSAQLNRSEDPEDCAYLRR